MIESRYWKQDLLSYSKSFKPVSKPPRWSEKLQVDFEKDVTIAFFMIRKLMESTKLSLSMTSYKGQIYRSPCVDKINNWNFWDIGQLYDFEKEEATSKNVKFLCNQLIHGEAMYAYREKDRNWGGIYTCSDFEREKYVYRIPLSEIINILEMAGNDYPRSVTYAYDELKDDYVVTTN